VFPNRTRIFSAAMKHRCKLATGEPSCAIAALEKTFVNTYEAALDPIVPLTPALLRLDPMFDLLWSDPRFQKRCEEKKL